MLADVYVKYRLAAFKARRNGDKKEQARNMKEAEKLWKDLSEENRRWANNELMAQVMAEGMGTTDRYGW